ncbi:type I polyketide synthase [Teredinibacter turnerae]|uniref:type I polyketide synthase n=1 Tax=Teredinibacter turnerae TaxID=2426 RepID=UPI0003618B9C|nr:type I polyketide synthase [Teredinibacter turnerae]
MKDFLEKIKTLSAKQVMLLAVQQQKQLTALNDMRTEPIAIIGASCRMPGGVNDLDSYWQLLAEGKEGVREMVDERWDMARFYDADPTAAGKMYTKRLGLLDDVEGFDAEFFGIAPREAERLDPQQRLLLETSWHALENAGQAPRDLVGSNTGVFLGICNPDYTNLRTALANTQGYDTITAYDGTGTTFSVAAGRIAYALGLQGPCFSIDTACSSSLIAIHQAAQCLRNQECGLALVGGVNLILDPVTSIIFSKANMLAPDGRCKTFDAAADGYVRGEGCGVLVLKRLRDAQADNDRILAVVRGSALNQDGHSQGLTAPNEKAQVEVLKSALKAAQLAPVDIDYIEAHGTGTSLGDPIEMGAIATVFGKDERQKPLYVGSVKTNIGHTEAAAGIAGVLKVVASLQHETIPPHLNFNDPSPMVPWDTMAVEVPRESASWQRNGKPRYAGVSSFGFGGSNAHVILEEAPQEIVAAAKPERANHLLTVSAKTEQAFKAQLTQFAASAGSLRENDLASLCYSANTGRNHFLYRQAFVCRDLQELQAQLNEACTAPAPLLATHGMEPGFLFSGQGSQYRGMGKGLYQSQPVFRGVIDECDALFKGTLEYSLIDVLWGDDETLINETQYTQPALFALEMALARLWENWGIVPGAVIGHSVGEYAAACFSGVFSLADGLKLIAARGRLMAERCERGAMSAVFAPVDTVETLLVNYGGQLAVAAINGPQSTVVSGEQSALNDFLAELESKGISYQTLSVSHAFHSPMMAPMLDAFAEVARSIDYQRPRLSIISNLTGRAETDVLATADYWIEHVSAPVKFGQGFDVLVEQGMQTLLEIGPGATLLGLGRRALESRDDTLQGYAWLNSLRPGHDDEAVMLQSLAQLYSRGCTVDWQAFDAPFNCNRIALPGYPFQRERYWLPQPQLGGLDGVGGLVAKSPAIGASHPLLGERLAAAFSREVYFQNALEVARPDYMEQHRLFGLPVVAGASHIATFLEAAQRYFKNSALSLSQIEFRQPLVLPEDKAVCVQVMLTPQRDYDTSVDAQLMSLIDGGDPADPSAWKVHVVATIAALQADAKTPVTPLTLKSAMASWSTDETSSDFYQRFWDKGYTVGDKFRWLGEGWRCERQALRRLDTKNRDELAESYLFYPGLLDACFQVIDCSRNRSDLEEEQNSLYIPALIQGLTLYRSPRAEETLYCYAQLSNDSHEGEGGKIVGDLWLVNEADELIASITGFEGRRSSKSALENALSALRPSASTAELSYGLNWQKITQPQTAELAIVGPVAVFADDQPTCKNILAELEAAGVEHCIIRVGEEFKEQHNRLELNPADPEQMEQLIVALERGQSKPWHILYLWGMGATIEPGMSSAAVQQLEKPVWRNLLQLLQRASGLTIKGLNVVTQGAFAVSDSGLSSAKDKGEDKHKVQPLQQLLWGMVRSAQVELSTLPLALIDLANATQNVLPAVLHSLTEPTENQLRVADGELLAPRLQAVPVSAAATGEVIDPAKCYLITGGMGGLGLQLAYWLVEQGAVQLVLLGRSAPKAEAQVQLDQLAARAEILCLQADVACCDQLLGVFERIACDCLPLGGIFHAAGVLDDSFIDQMDEARFAKVTAPKILGAWNLHLLSSHLPLDHFVGFSSITSVMGSQGQTNYAAANAFLDGLIAMRRAEGLAGLSINWGPWAEGGMAAQLDERYQQRLKDIGLSPLSQAQGMGALGHWMQSDGASQVMVANIRWPEFLKQFNGTVPGLFAQMGSTVQNAVVQTRFHTELMVLPAEEQPQALANHVHQTLAKVLGFDNPKKIGARDRFFDLGLDSLLALEMKSRLEKDLNTKLSATLIFDYPNFEALNSYLQAHILGAAATDEGDETGASMEDMLQSSGSQNLNDMDSDELNALLGNKLDRLSSLLDE